MAEKFLRMAQVEEATGLGRSTIYRLMKDSKFPKPVKTLGEHTSAWIESEIVAWQRTIIEQRNAALAA